VNNFHSVTKCTIFKKKSNLHLASSFKLAYVVKCNVRNNMP
jgi:hypothetical protein